MTHAERSQKLHELAGLIEAGFSCREIATRLGVSAATAIRWTKRSGLVSRRMRRLSAETRSAIFAATREGMPLSEAATRFGVSTETVRRLSGGRKADREQLRQRVLLAVAQGLSRRQAAETVGVSVATAIRWAREDGQRAVASPFAQASSRRRAASARPLPPADPAREEKREQLIAAVASGLSRRKAAALVGVPIATAIRWIGHTSRPE